MNIEKSPLDHKHNQIVTYTNPKDGFSATFQWDEEKGVYALVFRKGVINMLETHETGGVMGPIASSNSLPARVNYNYDSRPKRDEGDATTRGQNVVKLVEDAIASGDQEAMERAVNRSRWSMDYEDDDANSQSKPPTPAVVDEIRGGEHVTVFKKGVDFRNGGSIHF